MENKTLEMVVKDLLLADNRKRQKKQQKHKKLTNHKRNKLAPSKKNTQNAQRTQTLK